MVTRKISKNCRWHIARCKYLSPSPSRLILAVVALVLLTTGCVAAQGSERTALQAADVELVKLSTENRSNPLGIDVVQPRLSWQLRSRKRGFLQTAYQVRIAKNPEALQGDASDLMWDSGKVVSGESILQAYAGPPLQSRQRYYWKVRVWDEQGIVSAWSAPAWWEMGLLREGGWEAQWISARSQSLQSPLLRRAFTLRSSVRRARVYVTAHGLYQLYLNGQRVGDAELTPGFTSYTKRLQYQTYDITGLLHPGNNAIGALLGDGWYRGEIGLGWDNKRNRYGDRIALLAQLEIIYDDGTSDRIITDEAWRSHPGPIVMSEIYAGESYDARLEQIGWNQPGFDDREWKPVSVAGLPLDNLIAQSGPPVRPQEKLVSRRIFRSPAGELIADFGQNLVGRVRLSVRGPAGIQVTLRHGEVLDPAGSLYVQNLRTAQQTVRYTLRGEGLEVFEPHFTFQGFRYVAVEGYPGELAPQNLMAVVLHSEIERRSTFETSNPLLNQLQHNIVWSQKGNFIDIPMDCPQRDERMGWTGDAQLFAPTAAFNADVSSFYGKWLKDLSADQLENGSVPWIVPNMYSRIEGSPMPGWNGRDPAGAAAWGDAAVVIPWTLYLAYGDSRVLRDQYESMLRWVAYQLGRAGPDLIWEGDYQFGDWAPPDGAKSTAPELIATAYFAHSTNLLSRIAKILKYNQDAVRYAQLFSEIRAAFHREFVAPDGRIGAGTQTAFILALQFDLVSEENRSTVAKHLVERIRRDGHLTTGILGSAGLLFALSDNGYLPDAYRLLLREDYPSWLYSVKRGATTIWERWNGIKPDGSFQNPGMNSFNHYAYGAVGEWLYRVVGGINWDPVAPGYKHIVIRARPGGGLTWAKASHLTPYGWVSSSWRTNNGAFHLRVEIPANTRATIHIPASETRKITEGGRAVAGRKNMRVVQRLGNRAVIEVGSGQYDLVVD